MISDPRMTLKRLVHRTGTVFYEIRPFHQTKVLHREQRLAPASPEISPFGEPDSTPAAITTQKTYRCCPTYSARCSQSFCAPAGILVQLRWNHSLVMNWNIASVSPGSASCPKSG